MAIKSALGSLMINQAPKTAILGRLSYLAFSKTEERGMKKSDRDESENGENIALIVVIERK